MSSKAYEDLEPGVTSDVFLTAGGHQDWGIMALWKVIERVPKWSSTNDALSQTFAIVMPGEAAFVSYEYL